VRNTTGEVLAAGVGNITYAASPLQAEAVAVYKSIFSGSTFRYDTNNLGNGCHSSCFCPHYWLFGA
jgi:hypothetical protein